MDWYKNSFAYADAKENMTFNYQEKVKSYIEKRDRLLDKYEDNRETAWNQANKRYKKILTLMKNVVKAGENYKKN